MERRLDLSLLFYYLSQLICDTFRMTENDLYVSLCLQVLYVVREEYLVSLFDIHLSALISEFSFSLEDYAHLGETGIS